VFISVMVDESKDVLQKEQTSLCIRYATLPNFDVQEELLTFGHVTNVDAKSLCEAIGNKITEIQCHGTVFRRCFHNERECYRSACRLSFGWFTRVPIVHAHRLYLIVDAARGVQSAFHWLKCCF